MEKEKTTYQHKDTKIMKKQVNMTQQKENNKAPMIDPKEIGL